MTNVLLTFHCLAADVDAIAGCLAGFSQRPLHIRHEAMRGGDFRDASAVEQVMGEVRRMAVEILVRQKLATAMTEAVAALRLHGVVHWRMVPVIGRGRIQC